MTKSSDRKSFNKSRRLRETVRRSRSSTFETLERRELMAVDVPFSILTQNMQLRPSDVWEADPDGFLRAAGLGIAFAGGPFTTALAAMGKEVAEAKYAERVPNTAADNADRTDMLLNMANSYDIVALQEVFDPDQSSQLSNGARSLNYGYLDGPGPDTLSETLDAGLLGDIVDLLPGRGPRVGWSSGLGTMIRNAISSGTVEHHAIEFDNEGTGGDEFANKGFTVDGIDLGSGKVYVINTHLTAADPNSRPDQLRQIRRFMDTFDARYPVLLVGDINLPGESAKDWTRDNVDPEYRVNEEVLEYQSAMSILGRLDDPFRESFLQSNPQPEGWDRYELSNYGKQYWTSDGERNAYKYLWSGSHPTTTSQGVETGIAFSERHLGKSRIDHIWIRQGREFGIDVDSIKLEDSSPASSYIRTRIRDELSLIDGSIARVLSQLPGNPALTAELEMLQKERSVVANLVPYMSDHFGVSARLRMYKYVDLDANTGLLRLMGARGERDDSFLARREGSELVVAHTFDSQTFETRVPYSQVRQISGFGRAGNDTITIEDSVGIPVELHGGSGDDTLSGGAGNDLIEGDEGNDILNGGRGNDQLRGDGGDDTLTGDAGNDTLYGDDGDDKLYGSANDDSLYGGAGADELFGGTGKDILVEEAGTDVLDGEMDEDRIQYNTSSFGDSLEDVVRGGSGVDAIEIVGTEGDDHMEMRRESPGRYTLTFYKNGRAIIRHLISLPSRAEDRDIETVRISGLGGADILDASGQSDLYEIVLDGGAGNDIIKGSDARDVIYGGLGEDNINGAEGNDTIYGDLLSDNLPVGDRTISRTTDSDIIFGGEGIDTIYGGSGDDTIVGGGGVDFLYGNANHDTIDSSDDRDGDVLQGDEGVDRLIGGSGSDRINGGPQNDHIEGGDGDDFLFGNEHNDVIIGGRGLDYVDGGTGNDTLFGQTPTASRATAAELNANTQRFEELIGGPGADQIHGSDLRDRIDGGEGDDIVFHSLGMDVAIGGGGVRDQYRFEASDGPDEIALAFRAGTTQLVVSINGTIIDVPRNGFNVVGVDGRGGDDTFRNQLGIHAVTSFELLGGGGKDTMDMSTLQSDVVLQGGDGDDTLFGGLSRTNANGGQGFDRFVRQVRDGDVKVTYRSGKLIRDRIGESGLVDETTDFETLEVRGTAQNDFVDLTDFPGPVEIKGGAGNDRLYGSRVGNDIIDGGEGNDIVQGNGGNDVLNGGLGVDELYEDRTRESLGQVIVVGNGSMHGVGVDRFTNIELVRLVGSESQDRMDASRFLGKAHISGIGGDDELVGSAFGDVLEGGEGNDRLYGNDGDDQLSGNAGEDVIEGGLGSDTVSGGDGNDKLYGLSETMPRLSAAQLSVAALNRDTIEGGNGNDTLEGGLGNDHLNGGTGIDVLDGKDGNDYLDGGRDVDVDVLTGGAGRDTIVRWTISPRFGANVSLDWTVDYKVREDLLATMFLYIP
jgi:Ca2+-binding RTX toxin-like protein/endonuclease/exonuclease/phosphatase family metal-dependent hydrolase